MGYCTCYMDYPNTCHIHKNGKWKCVDDYECIRNIEQIELKGLPFPRVLRKTKCIRKGERMSKDEIINTMKSLKADADRKDFNDGTKSNYEWEIGAEALHTILPDLTFYVCGTIPTYMEIPIKVNYSKPYVIKLWKEVI